MRSSILAVPAVLVLVWTSSAFGDPSADYDLFVARCADCHSLSRVVNTDYKGDEWAPVVSRMQKKSGSGIMSREADRITAYLAQWGPHPPTVPAEQVLTASGEEGYVAPPEGYEDWTLVRAVYRTDKQQIRYILGNELFVKAVREEKWPVPDGAMCVKVAFKAVRDADWDEALVPESPRLQTEFMLKDSKAWPETKGWGFRRYIGTTYDMVTVDNPKTSCFECHTRVRDRDYVFTRNAR